MTLPRKIFRRVLCLVLLAPLMLQADGFDTGKLQGLGDTRYHPFESETLGHNLHLYVRLPESDSDGPFPVVYLLDGGVSFPLLSAYYHYLRLGEEIPELILVGISYGSDRFEEGNYRSSDFTAPSQEREWWGNAPVFQSVLEKELMPLVEKQYKADPARRVIFGHSLGGQFVLYSALTRPRLFWGHLASNPALHRNLDFFMNWKGESEMPTGVTRLFVAEGEFDDPRFREPADKWIEYWSEAGRNKPFELEVRYLPGQSHLSAVTESFRQGMQWLFPESPVD